MFTEWIWRFFRLDPKITPKVHHCWIQNSDPKKIWWEMWQLWALIRKNTKTCFCSWEFSSGKMQKHVFADEDYHQKNCKNAVFLMGITITDLAFYPDGHSKRVLLRKAVLLMRTPIRDFEFFLMGAPKWSCRFFLMRALIGDFSSDFTPKVTPPNENVINMIVCSLVQWTI